jgi:hypothetical protein
MADFVNSAFEGKAALERRLLALEKLLDADVLGLVGPIRGSTDRLVRDALETLEGTRQKRLAVVISGPGGIVEVAERIVTCMRRFYEHVAFYVPDVALSAHTILTMSGDQIWMDYSSCLGPIDPQVEKGGKLVPALSYLIQYDRLVAKAQAGKLTDAEFMIMQNFDQAELHQFEMARDLSVSLLKKWLAKYKFREWTTTETRGMDVTAEMRAGRAEEVAKNLMDHQRWGSHGRGIGMDVLRADMKLHIDDFGKIPGAPETLRPYVTLALDMAARADLSGLVHVRGFI